MNPPAQQMFQSLLFSKIVPNCKKLGLLDASGGWLRERFTEIGVIQFEDWVDTGEEYDVARRSRKGPPRIHRVTTSVDNEALFAAADTGTLWSFWAEQFPDRVAIYSEYGNRTFAEVDANANQLVRALRARACSG